MSPAMVIWPVRGYSWKTDGGEQYLFPDLKQAEAMPFGVFPSQLWLLDK